VGLDVLGLASWLLLPLQRRWAVAYRGRPQSDRSKLALFGEVPQPFWLDAQPSRGFPGRNEQAISCRR
jgi:hypothetical protein